MPSREGIIPGETIVVEKSQNVYAIAHQRSVPMRDLIVLNNLQPPFDLRVGQKLILPAGHRDENEMAGAPSAGMPAPSTVSVGNVEQTSLPPIQTAPASTVTRGETQYANTPKASSTPQTETQAFTTPSHSKPSPTTATPSASQPQQVASLNPSEAAPPPDAPQIAFVWPVQGPVLSGYGPKGQGLSNDGVNIGAPKGAPVVAAANGIVVYAGHEMKGFGNLVLIRHQGGWVTAYAHLDRVLVNKDAVVAGGDMIGTVGKSGNVASPQLHFETRYQGKPVDPNGVVKG